MSRPTAVALRGDRAGDKVRPAAFRLAFTKTFPTAAAIEAHLIQAGWTKAPEALAGEHDRAEPDNFGKAF